MPHEDELRRVGQCSIAHVLVSGRVKVSKDIPLIGGIVREFQLIHTLVNEDGEWYLTSPQ